MSATSDFPACLAGLPDLARRLPTAPALQDRADGDFFGKLWVFLADSEQLFKQLLGGAQPPDSEPGDWEFGPTLYLIHTELPKIPGGSQVLDLLESLGLPKTTITPTEWATYERTLDEGGVVASNGSLVARSKYAVVDYCWLIAFLEYVLLESGLDSTYPFRSQTGTIKVPSSQETLRLALAGDWGTGVWDDAGTTPPSEVVMKQMVALNPDFTIHLGDVYYAGTESSKDGGVVAPNEEIDNLVRLWQPGSQGALTLNSNHEMYSGARGLFKDALSDPLFAVQGNASYFAIEFLDWLIVGLDSAYYSSDFLFMEGALVDPQQLAFLSGLDTANKHVLVLTHHNGLNYNGKAKTKLWGQVVNALGKPPEVWYWGHVHNGVAYSAQSESGTGTLARCCGHGGLPFGNGYGLHEKGSDKLVPQVAYYAHTPLASPVQPVQKNRVRNGFAFLELSESKIVEQFWEQGESGASWENTHQY